MTSLLNNDVSKITQEIIEYIWEPHHHDAARVINHYVRQYFINFAKVLKPLIQSVVEAGADLLDKKVQYFVYNKHRDTQTIFNMLSGCRCCERHQVNKPKAMEQWVETKFNMTQTTPCECICRHYMRWMCREC
tara:strand:+ start:798 stop:1196 length:399 start_codon:yes stop_codon:yes gene_type:complete